MTTLSETELDLREAVLSGLAAEAGRMALGYFSRQDALGVSMKGRQDWLTVADGAVEEFLRSRLNALFPSDAVIGEEGGGEAGAVVWIIDPIDGTANFARGDRVWCISIGLVVDREPVLGIIAAPALGEIFAARKGRGATRDGEPIRVSGGTDIGRACIELGWSSRLPNETYVEMVGRAYAAGTSVKRCGSGALGLARVACGLTDAYAEKHINAWDVAAGIVIAREAGAAVNDFFAGDGIGSGNPILCCTPGLTRQLEEVTEIISQRDNR